MKNCPKYLKNLTPILISNGHDIMRPVRTVQRDLKLSCRGTNSEYKNRNRDQFLIQKHCLAYLIIRFVWKILDKFATQNSKMRVSEFFFGYSSILGRTGVPKGRRRKLKRIFNDQADRKRGGHPITIAGR